MRSLSLVVVILAGILACSNAAPQLNRFDLGWLQQILAEAGQYNSTVKFGNNTLIVSGISNAVANSNDGTIRPNPPTDQWNYNNQYGNYRYPYYYGGYWRMVPTIDGKIIEDTETSNEASLEHEYHLNDIESGEDTEDMSEEDEEYEEGDNQEDEHEDNSQETNHQEDAEDEPEEDAADQDLDSIEKELETK
ncbi:hypothetical protein KR018_006452 [Drosophila ironensis]|nr:hypothetical protein KR018_006452 [Drosophila ironensis]